MVAVEQAVAISAEDNLADILSSLNPPQQDYEQLADGTASLLEDPKQLDSQPSVLRALAAYCKFFGRGYWLWQITYDYPRIHEYLYGAYLQALNEGGGALSVPAAEALRHLSEAIIAYTWCENALITNDPEGLFQHSQDAIGHAEAGITALPALGLAAALADPIRDYLEFNRALFRGLNICAKGYLAAREHGDLSPDDDQDLEESLDMLKAKSYELYSELRAHKTFMKLQIEQGLAAARDGSPGLLVRQGDMLLRGIGYIGENLVAGLFEDYKKAPGELLEAARRQTNLPIASIHSSYMPDVFETTLGREYKAQMTVDLCDEEKKLSFVVPDGRESITYTANKFQVTISRFGSIAFEVGCSVEGNPVEDDPDAEDPETKGASVSHVRILESMVGPHAGRFPIDWVGATKELEEDNAELLVARRMLTFVDTYLRARDWIERLRVVAPGQEVEDMVVALEAWREALTSLAPHLPPPGAAGGEGDLTIEPDLVDSYGHLRECRDKLRDLAHSWMERHPEPELAARDATTRQEIFPQGLRFGRLMDVGTIVLVCISKFLKHRYGAAVQAAERHRISKFLISKFLKDSHGVAVQATGRHAGGDYHDIRYTSAFDANTGWQTVFCCNQLLLKMPADGYLIEPQTPDDFTRVQKLADFKGFQVQSREARAGIDDWPFASDAGVRNLAQIRSHLTDVMYVGENRTFLWFPDDPQFLTAQYVESARLIGDIRVLVLTYNEKAKQQTHKTEGMLDKLMSGKLQRKDVHVFEDGRNDITILRVHGDKILDLLRACTISKFEDHGQLLAQMLIESKAGNAREALEHNLTTLDEFYTYITQVLQRRVVASTHRVQSIMAGALAVLTLVSTLSAIVLLQGFLTKVLSGVMSASEVFNLMLVFLGLIVLIFVVGVIVYAVQRIRGV